MLKSPCPSDTPLSVKGTTLLDDYFFYGWGKLPSRNAAGSPLVRGRKFCNVDSSGKYNGGFAIDFLLEYGLTKHVYDGQISCSLDGESAVVRVRIDSKVRFLVFFKSKQLVVLYEVGHDCAASVLIFYVCFYKEYWILNTMR